MDISRRIVKKLRENRMLNERIDYENMDRDDLIALAKEGDQLAIQTLVNTHQDFLNRMSKKYFLDTGDKDDVKQLVTIAFWNAIQSWDGSGDFEAYAGMVIKRKMTDELRKEEAGKSQINTKADSLDRPYASDDEGGESTVGDTLQSNSLSPEEEYLGRDGAQKIVKFMQEELSEVERKVIMRYIQGYKVSEISEEEDMKYKTVENAIMRVKNKLADYMRNMKESRKLRESEESIFSDEEKQILMSVLKKIDNNSIQESADNAIRDYEDELNSVESEVDELIPDTEDPISWNNYEDVLDKLEDMDNQARSILLSAEEDENITDEEYYNLESIVDRISRNISNAQEAIHDNLPDVDPYEYNGVRRDEF